MNIQITQLTADNFTARIDGLAALLRNAVANNAAVGFVSPLDDEHSHAFWRADVMPAVAAEHRAMWVAERAGQVIGSVQLLTRMPNNQPHRAELAKMMVHSEHRRRGIGRALLSTAIDSARSVGKTLLTLDTRSGDDAQQLYQSLGFRVAGEIPDYAYDPDNRTLHATTYMYLPLAGH